MCIRDSIIRWYKNYLTSRIAIVDIKGIKVTRNLHLGCPQGGVLSVIIWNLVFDRLLRFFDKGRLKCIGYADDACLVIHGPNLVPGLFGPGRFGPALSVRTVRSQALSAPDVSVPDVSAPRQFGPGLFVPVIQIKNRQFHIFVRLNKRLCLLIRGNTI